MSKGITVVYERGVLRPLQPLELPENSRLEIQIIGQPGGQNGELAVARRALQQAGVIGERSEPSESEVAPVSDEELEQAYEMLGAAGPLSEKIVEDREGR